jgi:hypothetical protein
MSLTQFQDLVDRYGSEPGAWPDDRRLLAQSLLTQSPEARQILGEATALKDAMSGPALTAPAGLRDRIIARALGDGAADFPGEKSGNRRRS